MSALYISDLDGTLLTADATLSDFSRNTLGELLQDGLPFTVATARNVVSVQTMLAGLKLRLPIVEFNGAFLSDLQSGRHEIVNALESSVADDVYQLIHHFGCVPFVSTFNGNDDCVYYRHCINAGMHWYLTDRMANQDKRWRYAEDLRHGLNDQVVCLTVIADLKALTELEIAVKERHGPVVETHLFENTYSPGWYWLTVHDWRATKDRAVQILQQAYGFVGADLVVFGDAGNDIKLFQIADSAIAVRNATAELKAFATQIIGTNTEDSVAHYLQSAWAERTL